MSLEHAILGFLQYKPLSGYDLKTVFDMSVQHFWPADQSQIYRALSQLADRHMAEVEVIEQDDRPDRKVYHITDEGREELHRWLSSPLRTKGERIAKLIQVFFAGRLSDEEALALLRRMADDCRKTLDSLNEVPAKSADRREDRQASYRDVFFWMLTLEYGIRMMETSLAWFEDVIGRIERGEHNSGG